MTQYLHTKRFSSFRPVGRLMMIAICLLGLSACANMPEYNENPQLVASPDKASMLLAQAADRASVALETLAAVENAKTPDIGSHPVADAPPELRRAITINWIGPVEPLTQKLADRATYEFHVLGISPPVPAVVSIDVENMPIIDVLRSVGLQLGARASLRVNAQDQVIEIHYSPHEGISRKTQEAVDRANRIRPRDLEEK